MKRSVFLLVATCLAACGPPVRQAPVQQPALEPYHGCGIQSTAENPAPCGNSAGQIRPNQHPEEQKVKTGGVPVVLPKAYDGCGIPSTTENPFPCGGDVADSDTTPPARSLLDRLKVSKPVLDGYSRKDWKHWIDADKDCQKTRDEVLIEESEAPVTFKPRPDNKKCKVLTGRWTCPFTGEVFTNPRKLDVDHMVPLAAAHSSGGHAWDSEQRREYANYLADSDHLVAVAASANRSKGKKSPDQWMPQYRQCDYIKAWIGIKTRWKLDVTLSERRKLDSGCVSNAKFDDRKSVQPEPQSRAARTQAPTQPIKLYKPKRCKKGKPCGKSCIAKSKTCRK